MAYDPTDGTSLTELIRLVRVRTGDFPQKQRQVETGDGVKADFRLRENVYLAGGVNVTVEGAVNTDVTVDYDADWLTFDAGSEPTGEVIILYSTVVWTDERIQEAINAAIDGLFGDFYVNGENDDLYTDGEAELLIETAAGEDLGPEDRVKEVEYHNGSRWVRLDSWRVRATPSAKYVVFENTPASGQRLRVSYAVRPGNLDTGTETIEGTAGLPSRAKEPVVLYTTAALITDRIHHRIRDDRGHNTQGENQVKSYEIQNDAQFLSAKADTLVGKLKQDGLLSRVVY